MRLFLALQAADLLLTAYGLARGGVVEAGPVAAVVLVYGPAPLYLAKVGLALLVAAIVSRFRRLGWRRLPVVLPIGVAWSAVVCLVNVWALWR